MLEYFTNNMQILCKYSANIVQICVYILQNEYEAIYMADFSDCFKSTVDNLILGPYEK